MLPRPRLPHRTAPSLQREPRPLAHPALEGAGNPLARYPRQSAGSSPRSIEARTPRPARCRVARAPRSWPRQGGAKRTDAPGSGLRRGRAADPAWSGRQRRVVLGIEAVDLHGAASAGRTCRRQPPARQAVRLHHVQRVTVAPTSRPRAASTSPGMRRGRRVRASEERPRAAPVGSGGRVAASVLGPRSVIGPASSSSRPSRGRTSSRRHPARPLRVVPRLDRRRRAPFERPRPSTSCPRRESTLATCCSYRWHGAHAPPRGRVGFLPSRAPTHRAPLGEAVRSRREREAAPHAPARRDARRQPINPALHTPSRPPGTSTG